MSNDKKRDDELMSDLDTLLIMGGEDGFKNQKTETYRKKLERKYGMSMPQLMNVSGIRCPNLRAERIKDVDDGEEA